LIPDFAYYEDDRIKRSHLFPLLLKLIEHPKFPLPKIEEPDDLEILKLCEKFLEFPDLPELRKSEHPQPDIKSTGDMESDLLGSYLYSHKDLGWQLYNEVDRVSYYQICNVMSQFSQWESDVIKGEEKSKLNPNITKADEERLRAALEQYNANKDDFEDLNLSINF
jgi:hypothetical protein